MNRRTMLATALGSTLAGLLPNAVRAQGNWPDRPVRLIVPFPPAGGTDVIARELASRLGAVTGWNLVADNRPGAGGNIGLDAVAKAPADGYTIGMGQTANLAINPALYPRMPFDPLRDFALVSTVASQPNVLVVAKTSPFRTIAEIVKAAKAKPGGLTVANAGSGTVGHLAGELFALRAGIEMVAVPYRGAGPVLTDLLSGRVDLFFANPLAVRGALESGDLRAVAVTSAKRMRTLPEVPTIAEAGYEGFEAINWTGLVAPARTPAAIVARLNEAVRKALLHEEMIARLGAEGSEPMGSTPEEFRTFLTAEYAKWGKVVRDAKVQSD
ncbi:Extra-cytoplasmic solute receptor (plasmid) [Roseomonas mucosa]|uniref:Bug family tripartite tricarboxylate transporter substrate binding protein n=1 Tax=Roseomonas mucosa TaxID=207340 RepID=UPI00220BF879|nr:tripartite tricarboxylate transporter substrate binding protein [Roseomonas mucosa]QDJ12238.1 Extra-cytoplasmic solute receptor [Roseomonas mucosa]